MTITAFYEGIGLSEQAKAAAYGYQAWRADLAACEKTFDIADGELRWYLSSYAAAEADRSVVTDDTRAVNAYVDFLTGLIDSFGSLAIGGEQMRDYLEDVSVYRENREDIADLLDFCTRLYAALADVPADWTDATAYAQDVEAAISLLTTEQYGSSSYRNVLAQVGSWREKKDFYDIVYSYCLDTKDTAALSALKECVLPAGLEELYLNLVYALNEYMAIYVGTDGGVGVVPLRIRNISFSGIVELAPDLVSVTVSLSSVSMQAGGTVTATAMLNPFNAEANAISWYVNGTKVEGANELTYSFTTETAGEYRISCEIDGSRSAEKTVTVNAADGGNAGGGDTTNGGGNTGLWIGIGVAAGVIVIAAAVTAVLVIRKKKNNNG